MSAQLATPPSSAACCAHRATADARARASATADRALRRPTAARCTRRSTVRDPRVYRALLRGSARPRRRRYMDGRWDCDDLVAADPHRRAQRATARRGRARWRARRCAPVQRAPRLARRNTRRAAARQIAAHYDLGNDLFELLLDETMMYSCARLRPPGHVAATRRSCAKLELDLPQARPRARRPPARDRHRLGRARGPRRAHARLPRHDDDDLARAARARHAARARRPASRTASPSCCEDYRDLTGRYDKLVSIEMIEAVGWRDFGDVLRAAARTCSSRDGRDAAAGDHDRRPRLRGREGVAIVHHARYIFPGGCLPSQEVIARCVARRHRPARGRARGHHRRTTSQTLRALARGASRPRRTTLARARLRRALPAPVATSTSPTARPASASGGSGRPARCSPSRAWRGGIPAPAGCRRARRTPELA